jgi:hypothetical protein
MRERKKNTNREVWEERNKDVRRKETYGRGKQTKILVIKNRQSMQEKRTTNEGRRKERNLGISRNNLVSYYAHFCCYKSCILL